jgi:hypothetical protein
MRRRGPWVVALLALLLIPFLLLRRDSTITPQPQAHRQPPPEAGSDSVPPSVVSSVSSPAAIRGNAGVTPLLGETILHGYAAAPLPPENDLTLMAHLMENSLLLLKSAANRPLSANEDWADLLRGRNGAHERFLPDRHAALNTRGQLIDRWGTPLFFHALGGGRYEIRSAGPDRRLWTADDLHRNPDGSFRHGAELMESPREPR